MMKTDNYYQHPVFNPFELRIRTPPIVELKNAIKRLILTYATGATFLGTTRSGKTTALEILGEEVFRTRSGKRVFFFRYGVHKRDQKKIRSLLENICTRKLNIAVKRSDSGEALANTFITYLAEQAQALETNQIILAIDEVQRMNIEQIDFFCEIYDVLGDEYKIATTVLFFGNEEEVGSLLEKVSDEKYRHIEGRFFRNYFKFHGLVNREEVEFCLSQYDTLCYPENGPTYTEHFLPNDYARGFRLEDLGKSIWQVFSCYKKQLEIKEWPMEYFILAVNTLLTDYLSPNGASSYSKSVFDECINVSRLIPGLISEGDT